MKRRAPHDCSPIPWWEMEPNWAHYQWHWGNPKDNGPPCPRARMENKLARYKAREGSLEGFVPEDQRTHQGTTKRGQPKPRQYKFTLRPRTADSWDCNKPVKARTSHYIKHMTRPINGHPKGQACMASRIENAQARSGHDKIEIISKELADPDLPRTIYIFWFPCGCYYIGYTYRALDVREGEHRGKASKMGTHLRKYGDQRHRAVLRMTSDLPEAIDVEHLLLEHCWGDERLLNART